MNTPRRIQRSRKSKMENPNGLPIVYVGRPTKWGNPFILTADGWIMCLSANRSIFDKAIYWSICGGFELSDIIDLYRQWITGKLKSSILPTPPDISELKGKNLACWCALDKPCHSDILLELANETYSETSVL